MHLIDLRLLIVKLIDPVKHHVLRIKESDVFSVPDIRKPVDEIIIRSVGDGETLYLLHLQLIQLAFEKCIDGHVDGDEKKRDDRVSHDSDRGKQHDGDASGQKRHRGEKSFYAAGVAGIDTGPGIGQFIQGRFILRGLIAELHALFADTGLQMPVQPLVIVLFQRDPDKTTQGVEEKIQKDHDGRDPDDSGDIGISHDLVDQHLRPEHLDQGKSDHGQDQ